MRLDILKNYIVCDRCISRQLSSTKKDFKKKDSSTINEQCYICNGLMGRIDDLLALVLDALKYYQFNTFLIGAVLPQQMLEREDEIRSRFKIKGTESVKSDLTKELGKRLSSGTDRIVDYHKPDVTIKVDTVNNELSVRSKAIFLFGRYVKSARGLSQKQERCKVCRGKGCAQCNNTGLSGFESVEGVITKKLLEIFKCESAKFAWVGGESKDSLVLNQGRPFFVKVINPKLRFATPNDISDNGVHVKFIETVNRLPDKPLRFKVRMKLTVECDRDIDNTSLERLHHLRNASVRFAGKGSREVSKYIHEFDARASKNILEVSMLADGGLIIKQFVSGDGIEPSISQLVGCKATCNSFDVLDVQFSDNTA
ncbi:MAG: tRNA pseudouridine(54/55) synthase Pus10 [Nitrososphaerales archaeon]